MVGGRDYTGGAFILNWWCWRRGRKFECPIKTDGWWIFSQGRIMNDIMWARIITFWLLVEGLKNSRNDKWKVMMAWCGCFECSTCHLTLQSILSSKLMVSSYEWKKISSLCLRIIKIVEELIKDVLFDLEITQNRKE